MFILIFLILGGTPADIIKYPFTVLVSTNTTRCTGVIIDENWILTAGHCVEDVAYLVVGEDNLDQLSGKEQFRQSSDLIFHPTYDAVLIYVNRLDFNQSVNSIALSNLEHYTGTASMAGWGAIDWRDALTQTLQAADISMVDNINCDPAIHACTWGQPKGCKGDSGAPVIVDGELYAIHSKGFGCWGDWPTANLKISVLKDWIEARSEPKNLYLPLICNSAYITPTRQVVD